MEELMFFLLDLCHRITAKSHVLSSNIADVCVETQWPLQWRWSCVHRICRTVNSGCWPLLTSVL